MHHVYNIADQVPYLLELVAMAKLIAEGNVLLIAERMPSMSCAASDQKFEMVHAVKKEP